MNKFYDKLLLAVALIALLGAIAFFVVKSGSMPADDAPVSMQAADNPYTAVPVPETTSTEASWPGPSEQSSGWVYDVFTPPKIFIDENGRFTVTPWKITSEEPFGVYLADILRNPYRIQIQGYIEEVINDPAKSLILLYDEEQQKSIRARIGSEVTASQFKVLDFTIERLKNPDGSIVKEATVTILDARSGEQVALKHGERRFDSGMTVVIRSQQDPSVEVRLSQVPADFQTPQGQYKLLAINLEESAVTVEKLGDAERAAEREVLSLQAATDNTDTTSPDEKPEAATDGDVFDFEF